jgi:cobalt-zinc-cadmium efflux system membrane fusion protein
MLALALATGCPGGDPQSAADTVSGAADEHAGHDHGAEGGEPEGEHAEEGEAHDEHDADGAAEAHAGHEEPAAGEGAAISLTPEQVRELGISSAKAGPGSLGRELQLTGEVAINEDAVIHVAPRISGIIRKVHRTLGDQVKAGAPLLELDSIELAEAKSEYLASIGRVELARQTMEREKMLRDKGISAEQDYLEAQQAYDAELIARRTLEQRLRAMGLSQDQIDALPQQPDAEMTKYTVYAPVGGEIIEKHAALGELVDPQTVVFTIGDMSSVWVRLNVYQQDFPSITEGLEVTVDPGHGVEPSTGRIDYIEPLIGEETRTAVARVVLPRTSHVLRPGLFVTGYIEVEAEDAALVVPPSAVVDLDQDKLVFVRQGTSFEPRTVVLGRRTVDAIEVLSGIAAGEEIVVEGAFQLKAELLKGTFDPHAGHAH